MRRILELAFSLAILVAVGWTVSQASPWLLGRLTGWDLPRGWGPRSGLFPTVIGIPVLALAVAQVVVALRGLRLMAQERSVSLADADVPDELARRRSAAIIATIVGFAVSIWLLGFIITVPLMTFLYLKVAATESWQISIGLAAVAGVVFYLVFVTALGVPTPHGPLLMPFFRVN